MDERARRPRRTGDVQRGAAGAQPAVHVPLDAGLVLAGGASRRMGRDKATLEVDGERLVDRAVRLLGAVTRLVVVVRGPVRRLGPVAPEGVRVVEIDDPGAGPLGAVVRGLDTLACPPHALPADAPAAILAVDQAAPNAAVLRRLAERLGRSPAVVPLVDGRPEPLHAVVRVGARTCLGARFDQGGRSVAAELEACGARLAGREDWSDLDPAAAFATSWNRPEDLPR